MHKVTSATVVSPPAVMVCEPQSLIPIGESLQHNVLSTLENLDVTEIIQSFIFWLISDRNLI